MAESLQETVSYRQGAVVAAAHALANHQRVHAAVTRAAETFPEFKSTLSYMCPSWRDPDATDADELLNLLNLAPRCGAKPRKTRTPSCAAASCCATTPAPKRTRSRDPFALRRGAI